jgi:nucleotide-binding universal stress UspA family protein
MINTILVAVDDTPAALAGARFAVDLAAAQHAAIHAVAVIVDKPSAVGSAGPPGRPFRGMTAPTRPRSHRSATTVLDYVNRLGLLAGVPVRTVVHHGEPARCILAEARAVGADLVVLGRSGHRGVGQPYIGSQTREVLEFAETPVVVVPPGACPSRG